MSEYKKYFKKSLTESGPDYVPTSPNTAGQGGAVGNSSLMYQQGNASSTGKDTSPGDYRNPFGMGVQRRRKVSKKKKK